MSGFVISSQEKRRSWRLRSELMFQETVFILTGRKCSASVSACDVRGARRLALQFNLHARCWHNHVSARQIGIELDPHPLDGWRVAVHEDNFSGRKSLRVIDERLARSVGAELKLLNIAADALGWPIRIERNFALRGRVAQKTGRRCRSGVANKEDRVLWVF